MKVLKVMFLCTGNTCRSQIAEGLAREMGRGSLEPHSAGVIPTGVINPRAIVVMKELGIDISSQKSKEIDTELLHKMDVVITLCANAESTCPMIPPGIKLAYWPIDDPLGAVGTEQEIMQEFRKAREEIRARMIRLINSVSAGGNLE